MAQYNLRFDDQITAEISFLANENDEIYLMDYESDVYISDTISIHSYLTIDDNKLDEISDGLNFIFKRESEWDPNTSISITNQIEDDNIPAFILDSTISLYPIYEASNNIFTATFFVQVYDIMMDKYEPAIIESVSYTGINGISAELITDSTFKITGIASDVFLDEFYNFLMTDLKTTKILPKTTTEDFSTIIEWHPPSTKVKTLLHMIDITLLNDLNERAYITLSYPQTIHWKYRPSLTAFQQLLARGTI